MARFAERTAVPVEETILEIRKTVARYGGEQFVFGVAEDRIMVGFTKDARRVRFQVEQDVKQVQRNRSLARSLLMVEAGLLTRADGRCGFEAFKDAFVIPTPLCLRIRQHLIDGER